jgi:hypothetical protein
MFMNKMTNWTLRRIVALIFALIAFSTTSYADSTSNSSTAAPKAAATAAPSQASRGRLDIQVIVVSAALMGKASTDSPAEDTVSISYADPIAKSDALNDAKAFSRIGHYTLSNVQITTEAVAPAGSGVTPMTCITFTTPGLVTTGMGYFDIQPFLRAYCAYRHIRLTLFVPDGYQYNGIGSYETDGVSVVYTTSQGLGSLSYTYDVLISGHGEASINIPRNQADAMIAINNRHRVEAIKRTAVFVFALIFVIAIAGLVGYVMSSVVDRRNNAISSNSEVIEPTKLSSGNH